MLQNEILFCTIRKTNKRKSKAMIKNIIDSINNVCHNWIINFAFGIFPLKKQHSTSLVCITHTQRNISLTSTNKGISQ